MLIQGVYDFYGRDISAFSIDVWYEAMKNFDLSAVTEAMNRHLMNPDTGQFLPKPADIVRMLQGSTQDSALQAWAKVDRAVRCIGSYQSVAFDDPLIHRVLHEMGGWISLGQKTSEEWPFVAKEFENRYRGYRSRSEIPDYPSVLIGLTEAHNEKHGFRAETPVFIGSPEEAKRVIERGTSSPLIGFTRPNSLAKNVLHLGKR